MLSIDKTYGMLYKAVSWLCQCRAVYENPRRVRDDVASYRNVPEVVSCAVPRLMDVLSSEPYRSVSRNTL